jgi:predicted nucleotidyltransferase
MPEVATAYYFGLEIDEWRKILAIISSCSAVDSVILFGSRAKGTFREASDIDLALRGKALYSSDLLDLHTALDQLELLRKIDLVLMNEHTDASLEEHIQRAGIMLWSRNRAEKTAFSL